MLFQLISVVGAGLILGAYMANQRRWSGPGDLGYNLANLVGSILLAWVAVVDRRIGFIILEAVWALVTIPPLLHALRRKEEPAT